jgi:hypothetical protein
MDSQQDLDQSFIIDLHLSRRTFNALRRRGVFTVGKLKQLFQDNKLETTHFIGEKSIEEISNALCEFYKETPNFEIKEKISDSISSPIQKATINDADFLSIENLDLCRIWGRLGGGQNPSATYSPHTPRSVLQISPSVRLFSTHSINNGIMFSFVLVAFSSRVRNSAT